MLGRGAEPVEAGGPGRGRALRAEHQNTQEVLGMGRIIEVKVIPNSRVGEVVDGEPVIVKLREPPEGGKANRALVKLLAKRFNADVRILSGVMGRRKLVEISPR